MSRSAATLKLTLILLLAAGLCNAWRGNAQQDRESSAAVPDAAVAQAGVITLFAGGGPSKAGYSGDGGLATAAKVGSPNGIWVDKSGNVYFSDYAQGAIRKVNVATGIITRIAGRGTCESVLFDCGDGGSALNAQLRNPWGGVIDAEGNLYIADRSNDEVRKINLATGIITAVAGTSCPENGDLGCGPTEGFKGDGGPAKDAVLEFPMAVALDSEGNLYIADSGNDAIRKITVATGLIETIAGRGHGCAHQTDSIGDGCPAKDATLSLPNGLAFDKAGNLYISELELVRRVDARTGIITTYAGSIPFSNRCPGALDNYGDGCPATSITMQLTALAFDPEGNLNVMDVLAPHGGYVRRIDAKTGLLSHIAGGGDCSPSSLFCGDGGPATSAELNQPYGIVFDKLGNLYIADFHNAAVRKVTFDTSKFAQSPSFSPTPGIYHATEPVMIEDATGHAVIRYTLDGTAPTINSREYGGPLAITETTTINAIATAPGLGESAVSTALYTIERAPTVTTLAANAVSQESATFNARVNDDDQTARVWFVYGTVRTALNDTTSQRSLRASTTAETSSLMVEGLLPKTTYYFKAVATNAFGTASGDVLSFTTP